MKEGEKIHFDSEVPRLSEMLRSASFVLTSHDEEPIKRQFAWKAYVLDVYVRLLEGWSASGGTLSL